MVFTGFSRFSALSKHTVLSIHPAKKLLIFHRNFERKIYKKSSRNPYFWRSHVWTNFSMNFTQFREGFGRGLASMGTHFCRLGASRARSWVALGASWSAFDRPWTSKSRVWSIFHEIFTDFRPEMDQIISFWTSILASKWAFQLPSTRGRRRSRSG